MEEPVMMAKACVVVLGLVQVVLFVVSTHVAWGYLDRRPDASPNSPALVQIGGAVRPRLLHAAAVILPIGGRHVNVPFAAAVGMAIGSMVNLVCLGLVCLDSVNRELHSLF